MSKTYVAYIPANGKTVTLYTCSCGYLYANEKAHMDWSKPHQQVVKH